MNDIDLNIALDGIGLFVVIGGMVVLLSIVGLFRYLSLATSERKVT